MHLAAFELWQAFQGFLAVLVPEAEHGEGHQHLVGVQAWVPAMQVVHLGGLDRLNHGLWNEFHLMGYARDVFGGIQDQGGAGTEQVAGMGGDDGAVFQLDGGRGHTFLFLPFLGGSGGPAQGSGDLGLFHQQGDLVHLVLRAFAFGQVAQGGIITADDLLLRGFAAYGIVAEAVTHHVDAHIGRRLVGILAVNALEDGIQHGEDLDVAVVVDGSISIGFQMEGVDHVDIAEVGGGCFVGHINGVLQRQVPNGEGLKLGVARLDAAFILVVELAEANCHLAAAGTRGGNHHQRARGLHVVVAAEALL